MSESVSMPLATRLIVSVMEDVELTDAPPGVEAGPGRWTLGTCGNLASIPSGLQAETTTPLLVEPGLGTENTGDVRAMGSGGVGAEFGGIGALTVDVAMGTDGAGAEAGGAATEMGSISMDTGGISMDTGGIVMVTGGVALEAGGVAMDMGGVTMGMGGVTMDMGGVAMDMGGVAIDMGGVAMDMVEDTADSCAAMLSVPGVVEEILVPDVPGLFFPLRSSSFMNACCTAFITNDLKLSIYVAVTADLANASCAAVTSASLETSCWLPLEPFASDRAMLGEICWSLTGTGWLPLTGMTGMEVLGGT